MIGNATLLCTNIDGFISLFKELKDRADEPAKFTAHCNYINVDPSERALAVAKSMINISHCIWQLRTEDLSLEKSMADKIKEYDWIVHTAIGLACNVILALDTTGRHISLNQ